jgi:hypothetical protein
MRRLLSVAAAIAVTFVVAGCSGSGSSSGDPATVTPKGVPIFIEATIRPEAEVAENVEGLAKSIAGIDDLGALIVEEAEKEASSSDEPLDYEEELEPWLGDEAGMYLEKFDGEDFHGYGVAIETTDSGAAQDFIDSHSESDDGTPFEESTYEGVDYKIDPSEDTAVGIVDDYLVIAETEKSFKAMVDASEGESLADNTVYGNAIASAPGGSILDVFVDVGALVDQSGGTIDPDAKQFLDTVGIEPEDATALASLVPGSDQVEIEVSSTLSGDNPPTGDSSQLLGGLPASSVAAVSSADFGERFAEVIDEIDEEGIPGEIPPGELKKTMKAAGIDLEKIGAGVGNLGVFVEGNSESSLGGAIVLEAKNPTEAKNTVANVGLLLRATKTPGFTAISGKLSGFTVPVEDLGPEPLAVAAAGERIVVAYGLPAATRALAAGGAPLSGNAAYKEAVSALGGTPISGFVDGPAAVRLASALVSADDKDGFQDAKPYLGKIDFVAIGGGVSGDRSIVKLIAGVGK